VRKDFLQPDVRRSVESSATEQDDALVASPGKAKTYLCEGDNSVMIRSDPNSTDVYWTSLLRHYEADVKCYEEYLRQA